MRTGFETVEEKRIGKSGGRMCRERAHSDGVIHPGDVLLFEIKMKAVSEEEVASENDVIPARRGEDEWRETGQSIRRGKFREG